VTSVKMKYIGFVRTSAVNIPRHWSVSDVEGSLVIKDEYSEGLKDIKAGQRIVVIFHFHRSSEFTPEYCTQTPPHRKNRMGVFSICSPVRPNPIGMSVLKVIRKEANTIYVKGLDMFDGTPIFDIKPHVVEKHDCPSFEGHK
jgi:tRNA-Thr(GGU) m(6)t(6)A37 methyltransferase TsaA